jgi:phosphoglycerate dehydrogenase-like enzyme
LSPVKILITAPLSPELIDEIKAVDDGVQVQTLTDAQRSVLMGGETSGASEDEERLRAFINGAEVMFCGYEARKSGDVLAHAPNLRWLHTVAAGIEDFLSRGLSWFRSWFLPVYER